MALSIAKIKRDFAKHRAKAAFLGVLVVIMAIFIVKAIFEMSPRQAEADSSAASSSSASSADQPQGSVVETEDRLKHSRELWSTLRQNRGADSSVAFTFDGSFYPLDPKRQMAAQAPEVVEKYQPQTPVVNAEEERRTHLAQLREQARSLLIRSTVVGTGNAKPVAVINDQILSVGDHILGFEITNIKSREVEFKKDGITLAVKMSDDARGE